MIEVCTLRNEVDVVPIWLKGVTHLLSPDWETSGLMMLDLDFWTPEPLAQERALARLKQAGYARAPEYESDDPYGILHQHFAPLIKPGRLASLELHRHVVSEQFRSLVTEDAALRETNWSDWNDHRIGQLCAKDRTLQAYIQCAEIHAA